MPIKPAQLQTPVSEQRKQDQNTANNAKGKSHPPLPPYAPTLTPTAASQPKLNNTPRQRTPQVLLSNRKKRAKKSHAILKQLQKPLLIHSMPNYAHTIAHLAPNILPLYQTILTANNRKHIMPHKMHADIAALERDHPRYFRNPNPASSTDAQAKAVFKKLQTITRTAAQSKTYQQHKSRWNQLIHTPLLQLVFRSDIPEQNSNTNNVTTQCKPVISATIAGNSIPFLQHGPSKTLSKPTCSISLDSYIVPSKESYTGSNISLSMLQNHSAKVNYILAIDIPKTAPLRKTISKLVNHSSKLPHINQTAYLPLKESPIAMSIEVKMQVGAKNPIIQLSI